MRLSVLKTAIVITFLAGGSGCCIPTEATIPPLPLQERPSLYHWPSGAIDGLDESVAIGIKTNQVKLIKWGEALESVILKTHK